MTIIWQAELDGEYDVRVTRESAEQGRLEISRIGEKPFHHEVVPLAYQAQFGPDVGDVERWQRRAIEVVDSLRRPQ